MDRNEAGGIELSSRTIVPIYQVAKVEILLSPGTDATPDHRDRRNLEFTCLLFEPGFAGSKYDATKTVCH